MTKIAALGAIGLGATLYAYRLGLQTPETLDEAAIDDEQLAPLLSMLSSFGISVGTNVALRTLWHGGKVAAQTATGKAVTSAASKAAASAASAAASKGSSTAIKAATATATATRDAAKATKAAANAAKATKAQSLMARLKGTPADLLVMVLAQILIAVLDLDPDAFARCDNGEFDLNSLPD